MGRGERAGEGGKGKDERPPVQSKKFLRIMPGCAWDLYAKLARWARYFLECCYLGLHKGVARGQRGQYLPKMPKSTVLIKKNCGKVLHFSAQNPAREAYRGHSGGQEYPQ